MAGVLGDVVEVVLEVGETLLEVVAVRGAEVLGDETVVDARGFLVVGTVVVKSVNVAYCEEKILIDTILSADLFHGLFAKSQMYAKAWQHKD